MDICPVCTAPFGLMQERYLIKECDCGAVFCDHAYHYEHLICRSSKSSPQMVEHLRTQTARSVLRALPSLSATAVPELRMFNFELWPGTELHVLATSDGRVHNTWTEQTADASTTAA